MRKLKENIRFKRKNELLMLKAACIEKRLKKTRWFLRLHSFCAEKKQSRKINEKMRKIYKKNLKKKTFFGLLFKDGIEEMMKLLKKKTFLAFRTLKVLKSQKEKFYLEYHEVHFFRLLKKSFRSWRIYRVKCLRTKKKLVKFIQEKAQNFYFSNNLLKCLARWREIYQAKRKKCELASLQVFNKTLRLKAKVIQGWLMNVKRRKCQKQARFMYFSKLLQKIVKNWCKFVKDLKEFKGKMRRSRRVYRKSLKKKLFIVLKSQPRTRVQKLQKQRLSSTHFSQHLLKTVLTPWKIFTHKHKNAKKCYKIIKSNQTSNIIKLNFQGWHYLLQRHQYESLLSKQVIDYRLQKTKKILFNDWLRAFNCHYYTRTQNIKKIQNFQSRQQFKLLVSATKRWIKLFKSKENYRKLKKLSTKVFKLKTVKHYFLGFSIILEKSKIKKIKLFKAGKVYLKNLLRRVLGLMKTFTVLAIQMKIRNFQAIKYWAENLYRSTLKKLCIYKDSRKNKQNIMKKAQNLRQNDLEKKAARLLINFGISQKVAREEKVRKKIIQENIKKLNFARKYAKIWLNKIKLKRAEKYEKYEKKLSLHIY